MYTLPEQNGKVRRGRTYLSSARIAYRGLVASLAVLAAGFLYERFSHEVYSDYMVYAFLIPLAGIVLPFSRSALLESDGRDHALVRFRGAALALYVSGIAVLTAGCVMKGILEIYGTTNRLTAVYPAVGFLFVAGGLLLFLASKRRRPDGRKSSASYRAHAGTENV